VKVGTTYVYLKINAAYIATYCTVRVFTMDSVVLGLGSSGCDCCAVYIFVQDFALEDAIGFHAGSFEALACVRSIAFLSVFT
jgi:hypothetical protein